MTPPQEPDWQSRYQIESQIVDEVWAALGISTYSQAGGKHIAQIVRERCEHLAALTHAIEALRGEMLTTADKWEHTNYRSGHYDEFGAGEEHRAQHCADTVQAWAAILKEWEGR